MARGAVGLRDAIEALRTELSGAMLSGGGEGLLFELEPIELTLQVTASDEGGGKISWKIVEANVGRASEVVQTLKLVLSPVWKRPDGTILTDFKIAYTELPPDSTGPKFGPH